jgi:hypothetical protein
MRWDMSKVLIERPRYQGRRGKQKKGSRRVNLAHSFHEHPFDRSPRREPIRMHDKGFTDLLGPLYKFLESKVGRPWDDIYSEIREHIHPNSKLQLHLIGHLWDAVERNVVLIDGRPFKVERGFFRSPGRRQDGYAPVYRDYYICPVSGLLKRAPDRSRQRKKEPPKTYFWQDAKNLIQCRQIKGIWYRLRMADLPPASERAVPVTRDAVLGLVSNSDASRYYQGPYYALEKKQLNSHEIRRWVWPVLMEDKTGGIYQYTAIRRAP